MQVIEVWRYPVKSMRGERLESVDVDELGLDGDRRWGVFDVGTGMVLTARRTPELLFASARLSGGELVVTIPDGVEVGVDEADDALTEWLGRPVELRAAGMDGGTYENPMDFENDADWVSWTGPGGAWHDSSRSRVSIVSTDSLGDWELRRFRTNLVVDGSGEDDLLGSRLRVGESGLELSAEKRIDRCVMVTRPQPGLDRDIDLLKRINRTRDSCLSIGALVVSPGTVANGDVVVAVSAPASAG